MKFKKNSLVLSVTLFLLLISCGENTTKENELESTSIEGYDLDLKELTANLLLENETNTKGHTKSNTNILLDSLITQYDNVIPTTRENLTDMRTVVKIFNGKTNAGINIPGFGGLKLGKKEVNLNVYYIETKVVNNSNDSIVYGIGYSAHYLFKKVKRGLDISNLPYIAASVQIENKKTQVHYSLQTYGIKSTNLVQYFKPTIDKNFDVDGFGVMQSSIDGIHNILGDTLLSKSVKFTPKVLKFVKPYELEQ